MDLTRELTRGARRRLPVRTEVTQVIDPNSTIHVLSIEDDIDYERLIGEWLGQAESLNFQVTPAERLSDVARNFELDEYDCMLLDLGLPRQPGNRNVALRARDRVRAADRRSHRRR